MTENIDELRTQIAAQGEKIDAQGKKIDSQGELIIALHTALMVRQPGQNRSLLERMATVTVAIEGGQSTGRILIWIAGVLAAVGSIYIALHSTLPH